MRAVADSIEDDLMELLLDYQSEHDKVARFAQCDCDICAEVDELLSILDQRDETGDA